MYNKNENFTTKSEEEFIKRIGEVHEGENGERVHTLFKLKKKKI